MQVEGGQIRALRLGEACRRQLTLAERAVQISTPGGS
jgi:hypothetical protein